MLTLLPYPNKLGVVTTAAILVHCELTKGAKPNTILLAASLCLSPRGIMQAATNAFIGVPAYAESRVKFPSKL